MGEDDAEDFGDVMVGVERSRGSMFGKTWSRAECRWRLSIRSKTASEVFALAPSGVSLSLLGARSVGEVGMDAGD